jgi:nitronate monooxygenase
MNMEIDPAPSFEKQAAVLLEEEIPIFSFTFGIPTLATLKEFHRKGTVILGTATHSAEILALQEAGVDFIVCQGKEAGGHRGTFIGSTQEGLVPTLELIHQGIEISKKPLVAAGGIMSGKQIHAALHAGASAVQMGTVFLCCAESGAEPTYKKALLKWKTRKTVLSKAFTGKWARCIENRFIHQTATLGEEIPPYPIAESLTAPLREAALAADNPEFMAIYAGEGFPHCEFFTAQELIARLTLELPR